ncbi:MAG: hypothetical protein INR65_15615 [Gluconacetobacter diazotrophicus]|nr:hypothetical protein [Gluconacetobacter diazotrophicus]
MIVTMLAAGIDPAAAQQADPQQKRLNQVLAVLRTRMTAASHECLQAMQRSQETEKQLDEQQRINPGDTGRPNPQLDIARDVLDSDYETALTTCEPDARRVCDAPDPASARSCAALAAGKR